MSHIAEHDFKIWTRNIHITYGIATDTWVHIECDFTGFHVCAGRTCIVMIRFIKT